MPVDKSGRVVLVGSVPLLHPEAQTVEDMLDGWRNQQLCRSLDHETISKRIALVRRFIDHCNEYPWAWTPAMVEEFFADLRGQAWNYETVFASRLRNGGDVLPDEAGQYARNPKHA